MFALILKTIYVYKARKVKNNNNKTTTTKFSTLSHLQDNEIIF